MPSLAATPYSAPGDAASLHRDRVAPVTRFLRQAWEGDRLLTVTAALLAVLLVPTALGIWLDPRLITGAPAWLKPAKFAASTAIYAFTLAWVFQYLAEFPRTRHLVSRLTAGIFLLEIAIIDLQAWRGTTSHFNVGTPLDATLFATMGLAIVVQTAASVAVAVALWRQSFADRAIGWALRLGMIITILGAATGGLMTRPTAAQLDAVRQTHVMPVAGAHTVGAPDGGRGLPGTGWSTTHGDLRVGHFVGLHAIQALPLLMIMFRRQSPQRRVQLAWLSAVAYAAVFALLIVEALRGLPLVAIG
jgi:hypothetical protein